MQCKACGKNYTGILKACPYCGNPTYNNTVYPNKVATFLAKPREVGNLCLSNMNILLVLFINLSIASLIINLFTLSSGVLWCQYVSCGVFCLYNILRGFFLSRETALRTVRRAINLAFIALSISAIAYGVTADTAAALTIAQYVLPSLVIAVNAIAIVFLFFRLATSASFGFTCLLCSVMSLVLLIVSLINSASFTAPTLTYVAFGCSAFALANHILLWILSLSTKFKRGF